MPKRPENSLPAPKKARNSLVAYVDGKRVTFGQWGDPAALKKFAEFFQNRQNGEQKKLPPDSPMGGQDGGGSAFNTACCSPQDGGDYPLIADLVAAFLPYAKEHKGNGFYGFRVVCRALLRYASLTTAEFDAFLLRELQDGFVKADYNRTNVNRYVGYAIYVFRWGETRRLVPPGKSGQLRAIESLPPGMAREPESRQDVPFDVVEKTLPYLLPIYQAIIRLLMATGARPSEILGMKLSEIERKTVEIGGKMVEKWQFCPKNHKTAKKNKRRIIVFWAKEQAILAPYLDEKAPNSAIFRTKIVILEHYAAMRSQKTTPVSRKQRKQDKRRKSQPNAHITETIHSHTLGIAVGKAIEKANRELPSDQQIPKWTVYQIRHTFATLATLRLGEEAAALLLGHSNPTYLRERYDHSQSQRIADFKKRMDDANEDSVSEK